MKLLCYSFSISNYGEKNEKERYRTRRFVSVGLHRSFTCVFISHYSLIAGVVMCLRLSSSFFLLNDLLEGLAVLADYVDALLESLCAVSNLNATDGEHLYVVVYVSLC